MNTPTEKDILQAAAFQSRYDDTYAHQRGSCWLVTLNLDGTYTLASYPSANAAYRAFRFRSTYSTVNKPDSTPIGIVRDGVVLAQRRLGGVCDPSMHGYSDADKAWERGYLHGYDGRAFTPYPGEERAYDAGYTYGQWDRVVI